MKIFRTQYWDERLYPSSAIRDPAEYFAEFLNARVTENSDVLDIGAGAGERNGYNLKGRCRSVTGVDFDPRVVENPLVDRGVIQQDESIPLADNSVDIAFSIYVLEHVENSAGFCAEVARVLRPGGEFWALTPNTCHYVPLVARLTPQAFHKWLNEMRGRDHDDTFPTYYRLNSRKSLRRHFGNVGMHELETQMIEGRPNYLTFTLPTFLIGAAYERVVNSAALFSFCRVNLLCGFRLPEDLSSRQN